MNLEDIYREHHALFFSVAYRLLGTVADTEDILQDVFISLQGLPLEDISNLKAYIVKMITNRCLNELKSARKRRESYVGPWLPEPIMQGSETGPEARFLQEESISYAFLVLLQSLSPTERAAFVLKEVLDYDYAEVADMLLKSEVNCRKIVSRAKAKIEEARKREWRGQGDASPLVHSFLSAVRTGDFQGFVSLLTEDAVLVSDGGGKRRAALRPILGKSRIRGFFEGIFAKGSLDGEIRPVWFNGQAGILLLKADGTPDMLMGFDLGEGETAARHMYILSNPDKLKKLIFTA
ncbi:RNA polymerase sigma-70 factor [Paenibacillus whitsoniae]|uniref:RNA polymerase sigma-70 factor n=1 Tax=Paenibacillus whitsoniae TaxID=2496558 RepID=A0A430J5E1_9BACL|nr:RNA polymerase sigma-70 factor [Paenibacillus whitsoniae]RTE03011.1 RNA polymerase sigma-70 factor [Paenibacillus whitsoniae]